jgi:hypothetical protein
MKHAVLICLLFLAYGVSPLRAGSVVTITDGLALTGKLTLTPTSVNVDAGSSPTEIHLADILEANFGDAPFQFDYFYSAADGGTQLPPTWKRQDIGPVSHPGFVTVDNGLFTLNGAGVSSIPNAPKVADTLFFAGRQWTGNGQWTAWVKKIDDANPLTVAGLMLRNTLNANSVIFSIGATGQGDSGFDFRTETGKMAQETPLSLIPPVWLRLTRYGTSVAASTSSDGKEWDLVALNNLETAASPWVGLFADSNKNKMSGTAILSHVSFTPAPSSAQIFPPGVLLRSGSFLAGAFDHLALKASSPDDDGSFRRNGKIVSIPRSKIAAVTMLPTARSLVTNPNLRIGLLMKNGDFMDENLDSINQESVRVDSLLLGITNYDQSAVRVCVLHPLEPQPANYEVRLTDGSIMEADTLTVGNGQVAIGDVSGLIMITDLDEIAQIRAGSAFVQPLAELDWKATPPPAAPANHAPPVVKKPDLLPPVECWEGKNEEQIMQVTVGTILEFPLTDGFRAMGLWVAVSPDSPPNSQVILRVLANGSEVARTQPFKAGDPPRFMELTLQRPKTVTVIPDSIFPGVKVLLIDPVGLRDK